MAILITGASRGIGKALLDTYTEAQREAFGTSRGAPFGNILSLDVTDPASQAAIAAEWGDRPLDLLVCNAGSYADKGERLDDGYPAAMWDEVLSVNVKGVFLTIQTFLPALHRTPGAKIAIISSQMASDTRAGGGSYAYRASKAAALNLGRNLAKDLASDGIAVGIYHPGWVRTDMGGRMAEISPQEAASGLVNRFDALSLATSGTFEAWNGQELPF